MQLPTEGHGVQLPTEGHGVQLLTQGHEVQLPLKWAPVKPISSSYSLRIQQYKKTKPYLKKRKTRRPKPRGISVALDEYYYGRLEGVPNYQEEKDSFRFECFHCGKVLYNNVRTMLHINRHLYPEWVVDLDSGNLAGCLKCNRDFDNPFEMQTHYDKDHLKQDNPQCRICERKFSDVHRHMETQHNICEMPYICQLCKFRSSMHSDVVHHFVTKHNRSEFLLCLLCLHVMKRPRSNGNSGNKLNYYYYHHLRGHGIQRKGCNLGCNRCKLIFRTKTELVEHRRTDHLPYQERVNEIDAKYSTPGQVEKESGNVGGVSCLNAPAVRKSMDNELVIPPGVSKLGCIECKRLVGIPDHFRKYSCCSLCRFATNCRFAYSHHVTGSHCGQLTEAASHTPNQGRMEEQFYCACGFVSNYGNLIANHLVACSKSSCSKYVCPASALEELDQDMEIKEEIESGDETNMGNKAADGCMSDNDGEVKYGYTQAFSDMVDEDKHRYSKALSDIVSEDKLKQEVKEEVAMEIIQDTEEFS
ncbi:unnamed protein product [Lymnaea stagnalis]|uniref:C2H2-type domain-containing protein n=1 Tax=Lymnaea stagnalis TaxID=6523 RepID=A0AAV2HH41_LYMST